MAMLSHLKANACRLLLVAILFVGSAVRVPAQSPPERAWFGLSISCTECRRTETRTGERWSFAVPPHLLAVEAGSPAADAGLLAGDVLTHIDGLSLASNAGADRLASVRPGQMVSFAATRGTRQLEVTVRAAALRIGARTTEAPRMVSAAQPRSAADSDQQLRFSGPFGDADVMVRGPATTTVTIAERECWMEIRTGEAVVRLALREGCRKAAP
jgi:membrane-associated protease RseP (regulator of RpoE activity)